MARVVRAATSTVEGPWFKSRLGYVSSEDQTEEFALYRRELIREANRRDYDAKTVRHLITWALKTYPPAVIFHPVYPIGFFSRFESETE